jgi:hypothetical protein
MSGSWFAAAAAGLATVAPFLKEYAGADTSRAALDCGRLRDPVECPVCPGVCAPACPAPVSCPSTNCPPVFEGNFTATVEVAVGEARELLILELEGLRLIVLILGGIILAALVALGLYSRQAVRVEVVPGPVLGPSEAPRQEPAERERAVVADLPSLDYDAAFRRSRAPVSRSSPASSGRSTPLTYRDDPGATYLPRRRLA